MQLGSSTPRGLKSNGASLHRDALCIWGSSSGAHVRFHARPAHLPIPSAWVSEPHVRVAAPMMSTRPDRALYPGGNRAARRVTCFDLLDFDRAPPSLRGASSATAHIARRPF